MTKLSQPMIVALHEIYAKAIKSNITVKAQTLTALHKRGLITEGEYVGEPAIFLTDAGKEAIGVVTLAEILPGEDNTTESVEEDAPVPFFNRQARRRVRRNIARFNRSVMRLHGKRTKRFGPNVVIKHAA